MTGDPTYVYTVSSRGRLVQDAVRSIRSLTTFVSPERIVVFLTPPVDDDDAAIFRTLDVDVRQRQATTAAYSPFVDAYGQPHSQRHYGESVNVGRVDSDRAVFLACDTYVARPIDPLFDQPFEIAARPDPLGVGERWDRLFDKHDEPLMDWMPHTGLLLFDDGAHRRVFDDWCTYLDEDLPVTTHGKHPKDQIALALAASGLDVGRLTPRVHVLERHDEPVGDGVVYHHGTQHVIARLY